jgi:citrate lyase beta subunit
MNRGLTPPPEELTHAERIMAFWSELDDRGEAEGMLDGQMVDRYEADRARELLEWAAACAEMDARKKRAVVRTQANRAC